MPQFSTPVRSWFNRLNDRLAARRRRTLSMAVEAVEPRLLLATFTVINAQNAGIGSLRQAILDANAAAGADVIDFSIPGSGVQTISLNSPLPAITQRVAIDGKSQDPAATVPLIQLNGGGAGSSANGLVVRGAPSVEISGLIINQFAQAGILLDNAANATLSRNYIGLSANGATVLGNGAAGIRIIGPRGGHQIGVPVANGGNVISGNAGGGIRITDAPGVLIRNNLIGTDAGANLDRGNGRNGIFANRAANLVIGGGNSAAGNIIAGNGENGILLSRAATTAAMILGNRIGTNVPDPLGNDRAGILLAGVSGAVVRNNTVAFNDAAGIQIQGTASGNRLEGNESFLNQGLPIDLRGDGRTANDFSDADQGPNDLQNTPELNLAILRPGGELLVRGQIRSTPNRQFRIELFTGGGSDEAEGSLDSFNLTTNSSGHATFSRTLADSPLSVGQMLTATATDLTTNSTSELSDPRPAIVNNAPVADPGGPYSIDEGQTLHLDASATSDAEGHVLTYQWDIVGDETFDFTTSVPFLSLNWNQLISLGIDDGPDNRTFDLRVIDEVGDDDFVSGDIEIVNTAPEIFAGGTARTIVNSSYVIGLSAFDPGDDAISFYMIDWGDDFVDSVPGSNSSATHVYDSPGDYTIQVTAFDEDGNYDAAPFDVRAEAPIADAGGPYAVAEGQGLFLNASATLVPFNDLLTYEWDIDGNETIDFTIVGNPFLNLSWSQLLGIGLDGDDEESILLRVSDGFGNEDFASAPLDILNTPPTLFFQGPSRRLVNAEVTVDFSSIDPGDDTVFSFSIDWGDDSTSDSLPGAGGQETHVYNAPGTYNVVLTAFDDDGSYVSSPLVIVVEDLQADANGPYTVVEGSGLLLDASATTDPGDDTLTYEWDVNGDDDFDFQIVGNPTLSLTPAQLRALGIDDGPREINVRLRVSDSFENSDSATAVLAVLNAPPDLNIRGAENVFVQNRYRLRFGARDVGDDTITQYRIDWGDDTIQTEAGSITELFHRYDAPGIYTVQVTATDEDGQFLAGPITVNVNGVAARGINVVAVEGFKATRVRLATLTEPEGRTLDPENFTARVQWGDGTETEGVVVRGPNRSELVVRGVHTYRQAGRYPIDVVVRLAGEGGDAVVAETHSRARVGNAPRLPLPQLPIRQVAGVPFQQTVLQFIDTNPFAQQDDYQAQIDWGDKTKPSTATILESGLRRFDVNASHTYAQSGTYTARLRLTDSVGDDRTFQFAIIVS